MHFRSVTAVFAAAVLAAGSAAFASSSGDYAAALSRLQTALQKFERDFAARHGRGALTALKTDGLALVPGSERMGIQPEPFRGGPAKPGSEKMGIHPEPFRGGPAKPGSEKMGIHPEPFRGGPAKPGSEKMGIHPVPFRGGPAKPGSEKMGIHPVPFRGGPARPGSEKMGIEPVPFRGVRGAIIVAGGRPGSLMALSSEVKRFEAALGSGSPCVSACRATERQCLSRCHTALRGQKAQGQCSCAPAKAHCLIGSAKAGKCARGR